MEPPVWTNGDEALWHAYACAALAGPQGKTAIGDDQSVTAWCAEVADRMVAEHRCRFPPREGGPYR
jgi:hypothetical protein